MKVEKLRVGNLIRDVQSGQVVRVTIPILQEIDGGMDFYEGILICEEWFAKFGFDKISEYRFRTVNSDLNFSFPMNFTGNGYNSPYFTHITINYVHQLQNLYFALTGEELTIIS